MSILDLIMWKRKPLIEKRFTLMGDRKVPHDVDPPNKPEDAMTLGYRMGLRDGYSEGLTDGVGLGIDVASSHDHIEVC